MKVIERMEPDPEFDGQQIAVYTDLTLRDLFAAFALTLSEGVWPGGHLPANATRLAANAYAVADALIAARKAEARKE